jgi:predicted ATPase
MRFRFADCVLDADRFELWRAGAPVAVQPKVLELLLFLVRNRERAVTKQELLEAVWPDTATGEGSLTRAVSFARSALGERERDGKVIRTVRGRGYRIGVPVSIEAGDAPAAAPATSDFLCREKELALACRALDEALEGPGRLLLLVGEPGIGKTRLALELSAIARERGARVLWGRCDESEGGRAYWPWIQVLRAGLAEWGADSLLPEIGEAASAELAELLPELRERLPELPRPARDREQGRARLFDGVHALLRRRSAEAPLVLVLDDLHCADEPSLRLLRSLSRALAELRALLVGSYRDVEVSESHPLAATLAELARAHPPRRQLLLRGLALGCVERLMARRLGAPPSPALVSACHARSEGNPLFLLELLQWLESRGDVGPAPPDGFESEVPEGIRHVIRRRLAALSEPCRGALAAAAVVGREFPLGVLARVAELGPGALLGRLAEAESARALERVRGSPGRFRFAHVLIRETLYEELPSLARARLHLRAGEALEELYRPRPLAPTRLVLDVRGEHAAELAHHFFEAQPLSDPERTLALLERAGDHALSVFAPHEAARHFERALGVLEAAAPHDAERRARLAAKQAEARAPARERAQSP